jgi:hypothetical protein
VATSTASYCEARRRLPETLFWDLVRRVGRSIQQTADPGGGSTSITPDVIQALPHGSWIASASSEQVEVDRGYVERIAWDCEPIYLHGEGVPVGTRYTLRPIGKVVHLLADGRPVNFSGCGGMSDQSADLIMSLILIASLELAAGHLAGQNGLINVVDKLAAKHDLCGRYLRFRP